jgi:hypothetical protein
LLSDLCEQCRSRNARHATIDWQFTPRRARIKLKTLYPVVKTERE